MRLSERNTRSSAQRSHEIRSECETAPYVGRCIFRSLDRPGQPSTSFSMRSVSAFSSVRY